MTRLLLNEIFKGKNQKVKDQVIYKARLQYGYTLKDIVEYIGVHYNTVSRMVKKNWGKIWKVILQDPIMLEVETKNTDRSDTDQ